MVGPCVFAEVFNTAHNYLDWACKRMAVAYDFASDRVLLYGKDQSGKY
jgi:hypothetical protein